MCGIKKIAIIGYGELGKALHKILKNKSRTFPRRIEPRSKIVEFFGKVRDKKNLKIEAWDKKDLPKQKSLKEIIFNADFVFICVPSWCVRGALQNIVKFLSKKSLVICLSKGIESKTLKTMDEIMKEILLSTQPISILSGPMLAEELEKNKKGFAVAAVKSKKDFIKLNEIFKNTNLFISYSNDLRGVALCGVLKNIYSLGLGIIDGLGLGNNIKGEFSTDATIEMLKIVKMLGGKEETVLTSAGVADLIATAFSPYSRNRKTGENLGKAGICCLESEGYKSIDSLINLLGKKYSKFPFLTAIKLIVLNNKKPADSFSDLLSNESYT